MDRQRLTTLADRLHMVQAPDAYDANAGYDTGDTGFGPGPGRPSVRAGLGGWAVHLFGGAGDKERAVEAPSTVDETAGALLGLTDDERFHLCLGWAGANGLIGSRVPTAAEAARAAWRLAEGVPGEDVWAWEREEDQ